MKLGACYSGNGQCDFTVWAPNASSVTLQLLSPQERSLSMQQQDDGYWFIHLDDCVADSRYFYSIDGKPGRPDPVSHYQPEGVHGPSQVIDHQFEWTDSSWGGVALEDMVVYELHVGTFTPEGTFEAIIPRLKDLKELGITAIELMPVAQFPGDRNWGYDGVDLYAVQNSYGGPVGLKKLVNACHEHGLSLILDVVYNHIGPEGNYLAEYGPYFTESYKSLWGQAMNFDGMHSHNVRKFFLENVIYWLQNYHIDALRLDAIHGIYDFGAMHFLQEMSDKVDELAMQNRCKQYLIAESDLNDPRIIRPTSSGGYGLDAQWSDDFHHALFALLTGETRAYYQDFGKIEHLAKAFKNSFVYDWQYAPHRKRFHGSPAIDRPPIQFVVCIQNHDQIGNCLPGDRLSRQVPFDGLKAAAGCYILSPYIPMLFMGEEYGEDALFMYFISHSDPELVHMVQEGRKREFEHFHLDQDPPDPQAVDTFEKCKLNWDRRKEGNQGILWSFYQHLIQLRKTHPALVNRNRDFIDVFCDEDKKVFYWRRWCDSDQLLGVMSFAQDDVTVSLSDSAVGNAKWHKILDSAEEKWAGSGSTLPEVLTAEVTLRPYTFALFGAPISH